MEKLRNGIVKEMCKVLDNRDYPYSESAVGKIVDEFFRAKSDIIEVLSKHPKWNSDKLMIQFDEDFNRKFNQDALRDFSYWLYERSEKDYVANKVACFIGSIRDQFFSPDMDSSIEKVNALNDNFKLRNNMKSSKAILKICREMGWDNIEGFNSKYAMLCDAINPIKVTRHTVISVNPIDFLLMSNGRSWHSCHDIACFNNDPGCYSSGTISYMLDDCSFVFYTVDANYNGDSIELERKIQRQMFGYKDDVFIQSRLYPQSMDYGAEAIYTDIRNIVQKIISDCLEKPNLWIKSKNNVNEYVKLGDDATCYPDWRDGCPGSSHCTISRIKGTDKHPLITMGAKPICIECGYKHNETGLLTCCSSNNYCYCECCGQEIDEDDGNYVDGYGLCCDDCSFYCNDCDCYELDRNAVEVHYIWNGRPRTKYVCSDCASNNYYICDDCGEYWDGDDITITNDGYYYCPDCSESNVGHCGECGECHDLDNLNYDVETEMFYCDECYKELIQEREMEEDENEEE